MSNLKAVVGSALETRGGRVTVSWAPVNKVGSGFRSRSVYAARGTLPERLVALAEGLLKVTTPHGDPLWVIVEVGSRTVFDGPGCA